MFELLAKGNGTERIADELFIAVPTVKTHCYRLYQKLGIHSQQELIDLVEAEKAACGEAAAPGAGFTPR